MTGQRWTLHITQLKVLMRLNEINDLLHCLNDGIRFVNADGNVICIELNYNYNRSIVEPDFKLDESELDNLIFVRKNGCVKCIGEGQSMKHSFNMNFWKMYGMA